MTASLSLLASLALAVAVPATARADNRAEWVAVWESGGQPDPHATLHRRNGSTTIHARGAYGLSASAWKEAGEGDWKTKAHDPVAARAACVRYLDLCERRLTRAIGRKPSFPEVYATYRYGLEGFRRYGFDIAKTAPTLQAKVRRWVADPSRPR